MTRTIKILITTNEPDQEDPEPIGHALTAPIAAKVRSLIPDAGVSVSVTTEYCE